MSQCCPKCHLEVASHDPQRVQVGIDLFHRPCLVKLRAEEDELQRVPNQKPRTVRFPCGLTVH